MVANRPHHRLLSHFESLSVYRRTDMPQNVPIYPVKSAPCFAVRLPSNASFFGPMILHPKWFTVFQRLVIVTNRHIHTDRPRYFVYSNRPHSHAMHAMRPHGVNYAIIHITIYLYCTSRLVDNNYI